MDISNAFNNHFTDIGPSLASNITSNNSINYDRIATPANKFELHEISVWDVDRLVQKLSAKKSSGLDNIPVVLLKASAPTTIESLTHIINLVIRIILSQAIGKLLGLLLFIKKAAGKTQITTGLYPYCR